MDQQRPRGREKRITGPGKSVQKHGSGLGSGPVGSGREDRLQDGGNRNADSRGSGARSNGMVKLLVLLALLLLGGGGGLTALMGGGGGAPGQSPAQQQVQGGGQSVDLSALLGNLGGGSVSGGWLEPANTGHLDNGVSPAARAKRVNLSGGGRDTATIMVYMCGTDLESRSGMGTSDLQEMLAADLGKNVNLLVYTGGCTGWRNNQISSSTNQIWQVKNGNLSCLERNLGGVPMTDPDTLTGYIRYCAKNFPASRYELIFWDHGGGSISGYGYDEKFPSAGSMGLSGIDTALKNAGVIFDFIGFDACLMATVENALILTQHADYLIASEETEPGVGWYYTDWLTAFGKDPSMPTIELGRKIADGFVDTCAQKCSGQLTTLSVVDLAELEATLPSVLGDFSKSASELIASRQYQTLAQARSNTREFARSSRIDHVDLVHLAKNLDNSQGEALAQALLSAVKYNRTSSNMTNAYGLSIYFPYQNTAAVDKALASYQEIGMDADYIRCIQQFASLEASGQAVSGGSTSPLPALLGELSGGNSSEMVSQLLESFLGGGLHNIAGLTSANSGFLSGRALDNDELAQYLTENRFDADALIWTGAENGRPVLRLDEDQWKLVQELDLNLFYDDGEGFIDLGLDNVFEFDETGALQAEFDGSWLAVNGQPVAYYHTATMDDGTHYSINGYVPVLLNGRRAELLLTFDDETPYGYVSGVRAAYTEGETETVAKSDTGLAVGDTLEFLCDYYSYNGDYLDSYRLGEPLTVDGPLEISNVPLEGETRASYRFTDIYHQHYWTPAMP